MDKEANDRLHDAEQEYNEFHEKDLVAQFLKEHPEVLDDDIEDKFNNWLETHSS